MDAVQDPTIWQTLGQLLQTLLTLLMQLASLGFLWLLWIVWGAWCLWGVNWHRARAYLANGAWVPAILSMLLIAIVWSRLDSRACGCIGVAIPNFWWQLGYVGMLAGIAMFCGWLQSVLHWTPHELNLEPPAHGDGHGHDHGHHDHAPSHGHGHGGHGHDASHSHH